MTGSPFSWYVQHWELSSALSLAVSHVEKLRWDGAKSWPYDAVYPLALPMMTDQPHSTQGPALPR